MHTKARPSTPILHCLGEYIKVSGSDEPVTHFGNVRVESDELEGGQMR